MIEGDEKPAYVAMKNYLDGYQTGLDWKHDYMPGGPWHFSPQANDSETFKQQARASQENHRQWQDGFKAGLARNKRKYANAR